jgi:hypothetical protein
MVGQQVLALCVRVRLLPPQPRTTIEPFDEYVEGFFAGTMQVCAIQGRVCELGIPFFCIRYLPCESNQE